MITFKQAILRAIEGDTILSVKITSNRAYYEDPKFIPGDSLIGKLISLEEALVALDYKYNAGFGTQDCHDIYMWSADFVYYVQEYDGSTSIECVPRNPS